MNEKEIYKNIILIMKEHDSNPKGISKSELTRIYSEKFGTSKTTIWDYILDLIDSGKIESRILGKSTTIIISSKCDLVNYWIFVMRSHAQKCLTQIQEKKWILNDHTTNKSNLKKGVETDEIAIETLFVNCLNFRCLCFSFRCLFRCLRFYILITCNSVTRLMAMKKLLIPGIATGAVLIALAFVVAPAQEATAVHTTVQTAVQTAQTTVQANAMRHFLLTTVLSPDTGIDDAVDEEAWYTFNQPFELVAASVTFSADTGANCDLGASNIRTDFVAEAGIAEDNPAVIDSVTDTRALFSNGDTQGPVFGNAVLVISLTEEANCEADSRVILSALVNTTGALTTAPTTIFPRTTSAPKANGLAGD